MNHMTTTYTAILYTMFRLGGAGRGALGVCWITCTVHMVLLDELFATSVLKV